MKHTEAADDVKIDIERYLIIPFTTQSKDNPKHRIVLVKDTEEKQGSILFLGNL